MVAFLSDLWSAALFGTWTATGIALLLFFGACAVGLLLIPPPAARPALRALAGMPLLFVFGGTIGILVYLLGGTVRQGLTALIALSLAAIAVAFWRWRATGGFLAVAQNDWKRELAVLGGLLLVGFLLAFFGWGETRDGTIRAMSGAWGDGPLHTLIMEAFVRRSGSDLSMPAFVGEQLREPFGYDFVAAMLRSAGFTVGGAFTLPAAGLLACLLGWAGHLAARLAAQAGASKNSVRLAAASAAALVLSFGGLQWSVMAEAAEAWPPARFFGIHAPVWDKAEDLGLIWANHLNTFASQKHLLLAAAFLLVLAGMLLRVMQHTDSKRSGPGSPAPRTFFASPTEALALRNAPSLVPSAGRDAVAARSLNPFGTSGFAGPNLILFAVATGLLPLFHMHAFLAAGLLWLTAFVITRSRAVTMLGALALVVALPTLLWQVGLAGRSGFLTVRPGWMASGGLLGWLSFWLFNLGVFLPLVGIAVWRGRRPLRNDTLLLGIPALLLFLAANVVQFQPYRWDNFKLFLLAWLLVLPLVVAEMARWRFRGARAVTVALLVLMSLTTLSEIPTHLNFRAGYPVYDAQARVAARQLDATLPRDAVVLADTDTAHNHPLTLTGRTLVMGYGGWIWTRAYPFAERAEFLARIRATDPHEVCRGATRVGATHVIRRDAEGRFRVDAC